MLLWSLKLAEWERFSIVEWLKRNLAKDYQISFTNGVPVVKFPHEQRYRFNPTLIAAEGLAAHASFYFDGSNKSETLFRSTSSWLIDNIQVRSTSNDRFGVWLYNYPWKSIPGYYCEPPWASSLAQGLGISLLLRFAYIFQSSRAYKVANLAFRSFFYTLEQGGVISLSSDGLPIPEEYACAKRGTPLNGWIFSILGIYEYAKFTGDIDAWSCYKSFIKSLASKIRKYDRRIAFVHWTRYDNKARPVADRRYHRTHVSQCEVLFSITHNVEFARLYKEWQQGDRALGPLIDIIQSCFIVYRALVRKLFSK